MKKEGRSPLNIVRGWDSCACTEKIMGCIKLGGQVVWPFTGSLTLSLSEKTCQRKFPRSIALYCIVKESIVLCRTVLYLRYMFAQHNWYNILFISPVFLFVLCQHLSCLPNKSTILRLKAWRSVLILNATKRKTQIRVMGLLDVTGASEINTTFLSKKNTAQISIHAMEERKVR